MHHNKVNIYIFTLIFGQMILNTYYRNLQLGLFSLFFSIIGIAYYSTEEVMSSGIFFGYNYWVVLLICFQSGKFA